ncbi:hypothetical protein [Isoptericola aurantiacus]|uniref:hypothetical protein n=1 Tax=Isoptericola aurantiacus TaxID=3377839 RepID=UPI00383BAD15
MSSGPGTGPDGPELDPAASLDLIAESRRRAHAGTEPDGRLLCLAWGVAWTAGYLVLWSSARELDGMPSALAFVIFGGLLAAAVVLTIVHSVRRAAGVRGPSRRTGALWGSTWSLAFVTYPFIISGLARAGASDDVLGLAANALACVIVGIMYLTGAACFGDTSLSVLGAWILLTGGAATLAGMPATYLVMAVLGGGGFLVITLAWQALLLARRRRAAHASAARDGRTAVGQEPGDD